MGKIYEKFMRLKKMITQALIAAGGFGSRLLREIDDKKLPLDNFVPEGVDLSQVPKYGKQFIYFKGTPVISYVVMELLKAGD